MSQSPAASQNKCINMSLNLSACILWSAPRFVLSHQTLASLIEWDLHWCNKIGEWDWSFEMKISAIAASYSYLSISRRTTEAMLAYRILWMGVPLAGLYVSKAALANCGAQSVLKINGGFRSSSGNRVALSASSLSKKSQWSSVELLFEKKYKVVLLHLSTGKLFYL